MLHIFTLMKPTFLGVFLKLDSSKTPISGEKNQALNTFEFQESLQKLGESRKRIYDDGENFVIDLSSNKNQ